MNVTDLPSDALDLISEFDGDRLLKNSVDSRGEYWQLESSDSLIVHSLRYRDLILYIRNDDRGFSLPDFSLLRTAYLTRSDSKIGSLVPRQNRSFFEIFGKKPADDALIKRFLNFRMHVGRGKSGWFWGDRASKSLMHHMQSPFGNEGHCTKKDLLTLIHLYSREFIELRSILGGYQGCLLGDRVESGYLVLPHGGSVRIPDLRRLLCGDVLPNFLEFRRVCVPVDSAFVWGDRGAGYGLVDPSGLGVLNISSLCRDILAPRAWARFLLLRKAGGGLPGCEWGDRGTPDGYGLLSPSGEVCHTRDLGKLLNAVDRWK